MPERGEVKRARRDVEEVMSDWSAIVVGWPRELPREMRVEEMMPVLVRNQSECWSASMALCWRHGGTRTVLTRSQTAAR